MVETLGDKLRLTRESKGYSYEYVGRETNIARRYLEALEREDFTKFPGEPYLLGFLRNYGEYLGLDVDELLSLYRALKIQEQPTPMEELLKAPAPSFPVWLVFLIVLLPILAILGGGIYFIFLRPASQPGQEEPVYVPVEYVLEEGGFLERRFYRGDTVLIGAGAEQFKAELEELGDPLTIKVPGGRAELRLGGDTELDLNGDGAADIRVSLSDYDKDSPGAGALLRFDSNVFGIPPADAADGAAAVPRGAQSTVIFSSSNAYPFTLQVQFQGFCMFRWEVDRRERNERYFSRGEELNIQAQNGLRLWVSNAASLRLRVIGAGRTVPLELGGAGEVVVSDLRWLKDDGGRFRLSQYRLE
ncbi:MAG: helix-turn-helix domain-containing protein [Treponema sp.]|jgi:cytoskeletal protein RodZ|nr:helix-turn-helix domain-containing protein [Treponema sp.]